MEKGDTLPIIIMDIMPLDVRGVDGTWSWLSIVELEAVVIVPTEERK
jgi:hypothetical protein